MCSKQIKLAKTTLFPFLFQPHHRLHRHNSGDRKSPGRDLGMLGVLIHVIGDAVNNIGVIVAAAIIWKTSSPQRFYADPAVSLFIALMILATAWPLVKHSGYILLQGAPATVKLDDVQHDLEKVNLNYLLYIPSWLPLANTSQD